MTDERSTEPPQQQRDTKRPWTDPTIEATPIADTDGTPHPPPGTDGITAVS